MLLEQAPDVLNLGTRARRDTALARAADALLAARAVVVRLVPVRREGLVCREGGEVKVNLINLRC